MNSFLDFLCQSHPRIPSRILFSNGFNSSSWIPSEFPDFHRNTTNNSFKNVAFLQEFNISPGMLKKLIQNLIHEFVQIFFSQKKFQAFFLSNSEGLFSETLPDVFQKILQKKKPMKILPGIPSKFLLIFFRNFQRNAFRNFP